MIKYGLIIRKHARRQTEDEYDSKYASKEAVLVNINERQALGSLETWQKKERKEHSPQQI